MNLASFQERIRNNIYDILLSGEEEQIIVLYGDEGSGKSTIARAVAEQLKENWTVFYIAAICAHCSPYLTWHLGTKLY